MQPIEYQLSIGIVPNLGATLGILEERLNVLRDCPRCNDRGEFLSAFLVRMGFPRAASAPPR